MNHEENYQKKLQEILERLRDGELVKLELNNHESSRLFFACGAEIPNLQVWTEGQRKDEKLCMQLGESKIAFEEENKESLAILKALNSGCKLTIENDGCNDMQEIYQELSQRPELMVSLEANGNIRLMMNPAYVIREK